MATDRGRHAQNIIRSIDPFLPPSILDDSNLRLDGLIRSRVLTALLLSAIAVTVLSVGTIIIASFINPEDFTAPIALGAASIVLVSLNYLFFYKTGHLDASAMMFSLTFLVMDILSIILTGGFESPVMPMLLATPVVAFLIGGRQEGLYYAALCWISGTILMVFHAYDFPMMNLLTEDVQMYVWGITWFVATTVIVTCLYIYDLLLEDMRSTTVRVDRKSQ